MHFASTYSSWLNQVERWFAPITECAIRRNSFTSVRELKQQIDLFVQRYNADATPLRWIATADSILQKFKRIAKRIFRERTLARKFHQGRTHTTAHGCVALGTN
jgi:putative transposase